MVDKFIPAITAVILLITHYGVCQSESPSCLPLDDNSCNPRNDTCCTGLYCWEPVPNQWAYGVCKELLCDPEICYLPDCSCSNRYLPGDLQPTVIPLLVFVTFDGAPNEEDYYNIYEEIFNGTNPNGSPFSGTFFITHDRTNYIVVNELYNQGHEIALSSISHKDTPYQEYWKKLDAEGWKKECIDLRSTIATLANIPENDIIGFRAPYLQGGGDVMAQVLYENGIEYASYRTSVPEDILWPYTADFDSDQSCMIEACPQGLYPGFWEFPINAWVCRPPNQPGCSMAYENLTPKNASDAYEYFYTNFERHYDYSNKAPFGIHLHSYWLTQEILEGVLTFFQYLDTLDDVYVVSMTKGLDWLKYPKSLYDQPPTSWGAPSIATSCVPNECAYNETYLPTELRSEGDRYMLTCTPCPNSYPWVGNPLGKNKYE